MIAIVDYGVGNLFSLQSSLAAIGESAAVTADARVLREADGIILPGVGAFGDAAEKLSGAGLAEPIIALAKEGRPLLGICLGMQLLLDKGLEFGEHQGLGLIPGTVRPIADVIPTELKIPQIGWNALKLTQPDNPLFRYVREGDYAYFVHSFYADAEEQSVIAVTDYGVPLTAAIARGNVFGCQFHPEKSGKTGLNILRAFCEGNLC